MNSNTCSCFHILIFSYTFSINKNIYFYKNKTQTSYCRCYCGIVMKLISKSSKKSKVGIVLSSICNLFWWSWCCWNSWQKLFFICHIVIFCHDIIILSYGILVKNTINFSVHFSIYYFYFCSIYCEKLLKNWTLCFLQNSKYTSYKTCKIGLIWYGYFAKYITFLQDFIFGKIQFFKNRCILMHLCYKNLHT